MARRTVRERDGEGDPEVRHPIAVPPSYAVLKPGASDDEIVALEEAFGVSLPEELKALWRLSAGESGVDGSDLMLGGWALMPLDAVIGVYQMQMRFQEENGADDTEWLRFTGSLTGIHADDLVDAAFTADFTGLRLDCTPA
ncbi:SMI1/KNR4 family protein [Streptomyces sp. NBC_00775]|nr:SMI1/KNR4 family protein [Streptomyces sp. NBC_00775]